MLNWVVIINTAGLQRLWHRHHSVIKCIFIEHFAIYSKLCLPLIQSGRKPLASSAVTQQQFFFFSLLISSFNSFNLLFGTKRNIFLFAYQIQYNCAVVFDGGINSAKWHLLLLPHVQSAEAALGKIRLHQGAVWPPGWLTGSQPQWGQWLLWVAVNWLMWWQKQAGSWNVKVLNKNQTV